MTHLILNPITCNVVIWHQIHALPFYINSNSMSQTAVHIHSQTPCFCDRGHSYRLHRFLPGASSRRPSAQLLRLAAGESRCSLARKGRQGWGRSWAQGSQGAAGHNHPELSHQTNETKCHKRVGVVAFSDPSNLYDFSSLPLHFLVRRDNTALHRVFICSFQYFEEILKNRSHSHERRGPVASASLMDEHSALEIQDTHRPDLTLMSPQQVCPFLVPHLHHSMQFLQPEKHSGLELCLLNGPLGYEKVQ